MSASVEYEKWVGQLSADIRDRESALIEVGRVHAEMLDGGHAPSGARVQHVLTELRKLNERWERLIQPAPAPPVEPERSQLDELRERRQRQMGGSAG